MQALLPRLAGGCLSLLCCRANPYGEHYLDGISLNPFEVLFVKARAVWLRQLGAGYGCGNRFGTLLLRCSGMASPALPSRPRALLQVKERVLQNDWSFAVQAVKYAHWMEAQARLCSCGPAGLMAARCGSCGCRDASWKGAGSACHLAAQQRLQRTDSTLPISTRGCAGIRQAGRGLQCLPRQQQAVPHAAPGLPAGRARGAVCTGAALLGERCGGRGSAALFVHATFRASCPCPLSGSGPRVL